MGFARVPQAWASRRSRDPRLPHAVVVDRGSVHGRVSVLCDGRPPRLRVARRRRRRWCDVLRRFDLLHERRLPPVRGGRRHGTGARYKRPAVPARLLGAAPDRLAGDRDPARRHRLLQHQHVPGDAGRLRRRAGRPARLAARRVGSVCFLVASWLAFAEAGHGWLSWRPHDLGWTIAALNLGGSIFFGLSAIGAYVIPSTGEILSAALANGGTFLGAIGFLIGAALLLPEGSSSPEPARGT